MSVRDDTINRNYRNTILSKVFLYMFPIFTITWNLNAFTYEKIKTSILRWFFFFLPLSTIMMNLEWDFQTVFLGQYNFIQIQLKQFKWCLYITNNITGTFWNLYYVQKLSIASEHFKALRLFRAELQKKKK